MSKSIDVQLSRLNLPSTCGVCLSPAYGQYELQKIFTYGRRSDSVKIHVPMCSQHLEAANFKGTAEKLMETLAVVVGIGAGILAAIVLWLAWQPTEYDRIILKLFSGTRLQGSAQRGADHALLAEG